MAVTTLPKQSRDIHNAVAAVTEAQATSGALKALADLQSAAQAIAASNATLESLTKEAAPYEQVGALPPQDLINRVQAAKREAVLVRAQYQQQLTITGWLKGIAQAKADAAQARARGDLATAALKEGAAQVLADAVLELSNRKVNIKLPPGPALGGTMLAGLGLMKLPMDPIKSGGGGVVSPPPKPVPAPAPAPTPPINTGIAPPPSAATAFRDLPRKKTANELAKEWQVQLDAERKLYPSDPTKYGGKQGNPPSRWAENSQWTVGLNPVQLKVLDWAPNPAKQKADGTTEEDGSTSTVIKALQAVKPADREQWFWDTYIQNSPPVSLPDFHPQWVVDLQAGRLGRSGIVGALQDVGDFVVENAATIATIAAVTVAVVAAIPSGGASLASIPLVLSAAGGAAATVGVIAKAAEPLRQEVQDLVQGNSADAMKYAPVPNGPEIPPTAAQYNMMKEQAASTATQAAKPDSAANIAGPTAPNALFPDPTQSLAAQSTTADVPPAASKTSLLIIAGGGLALIGGLIYFLEPSRAAKPANLTPAKV